MKNFKLFRGIVTIALVTTLMIACGGEPDRSSEDQESSSSSVAAQAQPESKLNLNTATEEQFSTIPGVGDRMVGEFLEYRPYISIQQFRREIGKYVDDEQVAAYEQYVFVPVDPNESDAATLQQIPGLDAAEADELIAGRPYDSNDAFLEQLSAYVNEDELSTARSYLTN